MRGAALVTLACLSACGGSSLPASGVQRKAIADQSAQRTKAESMHSSGPTRAELCGRFQAFSRAVLASATPAVRDLFEEQWARDGTDCAVDAPGSERAWGLVVAKLRDEDDPDVKYGLAVRYGLARIGPNQPLVIEPLRSAQFIEPASFDPLEAFDVDGDGVPEVFVRSSYEHEGSIEEATGLFTFRDGKTECYPVGDEGPISLVADIDKDGHPDLIVRTILDGGVACGGFSNEAFSPGFALHADRKGSFLDKDDAARSYAKTWCPEWPKDLGGLEDVVCRRLYGESAAALEAELAATFVPESCRLAIAGITQPKNARRDYELLRSAARIYPPFQLQ